jgi:fluoroacetyl-CoA thioesterase
MTSSFAYRVPESKTVPHLYPEAAMFQEMPAVFATGFMVGLLEWACIEAIKDHIDWPATQSVGTAVDVTHRAPTPPGLTVRVTTELIEVDGRRLLFKVRADDGIDVISEGTHERHLIDPARFAERIARKRAQAAR